MPTYNTDQTARYAPDVMMSIRGPRAVTRWATFGPGERPKGVCIDPDGTAVLCTLSNGDTRVFGCDHAYINSELRMVIVGHNPKDEVRAKWEPVPADLLN